MAILGLVITAPSAGAAMIEHEFGGVITSADASTGVAAGTRISGTFAYDPEAQPFVLTFEGFHGYQFGESPIGASPPPDTSRLTLNIGGNPLYDERGLTVDVAAFPGVPDALPYPGPPSSSAEIWGLNDHFLIDLRLSNAVRAVDPTLALPSSLSLADFPQANLVVIDRTVKFGLPLYQARIDTLTTVPEPTGLCLLGLTAVGLAARRFRPRPGGL